MVGGALIQPAADRTRVADALDIWDTDAPGCVYWLGLSRIIRDWRSRWSVTMAAIGAVHLVALGEVAHRSISRSTDHSGGGAALLWFYASAALVGGCPDLVSTPAE